MSEKVSTLVLWTSVPIFQTLDPLYHKKNQPCRCLWLKNGVRNGDFMKKKQPLIIILSALIIFCVLICLLFLFEAGNGSINNIGDAIWYVIATISTAGYGDIVPATVGGRVVSVILLLASLGFISLMISGFVAFISGDFLPYLKLKKALKGRLNIFLCDNEGSRLFAELLCSDAENKHQPKPTTIFLDEKDKIRIDFCEEDDFESFYVSAPLDWIFDLKKDSENVNLFYFDDNGWKNFLRASEAADQTAAHVYAITEGNLDEYKENLTLFNKYDICARSYWNNYPVNENEKNIIIAGDGKFRDAILNRALLINIFEPEQTLYYKIAGDANQFLSSHYELFRSPDYETDICKSFSFAEEPFDKISFYKSFWDISPAEINNADRIIICMDVPEANPELLWKIKTAFPFTGKIYVLLTSAEIESTDSIIPFGDKRSVFTRENIMQERRNKLAIRLHEDYRNNADIDVERWEQLLAFHRESNIAAADHLHVKCKLLLGDERYKELKEADSTDIFKEAFHRYEMLYNDPEARDCFRRIEHNRWVRFHLVNNWHYEELRNNEKRAHNLIVPYDQLSESDKAKDDAAWKIIGRL